MSNSNYPSNESLNLLDALLISARQQLEMEPAEDEDKTEIKTVRLTMYQYS